MNNIFSHPTQLIREGDQNMAQLGYLVQFIELGLRLHTFDDPRPIVEEEDEIRDVFIDLTEIGRID